MDYSEVIKFAFSWLKDVKTWKYAGAMMGILFLQTVISVLLLGNSYTTGFTPGTISSAINVILLQVVIWLVATLSVMYLSVLILLRAMDLAGFKHEPMAAGKFVRYIILLIANYFAAMLSLLHRKGLLVLITSVLLVIFGEIIAMVAGGDQAISLVSVIMLGLGAILAIPVLVFWIYNSFRLFASPLFFVQHRLGIIESIKSSWKLTKGRVTEIFIAEVLFGFVLLGVLIVFGIVSLAVSVPITVALMFTSPMVVAITNGLLNAISVSITSALTMFFLTGLYIELFREHGIEKPKQQNVVPATAPAAPRPSTML